MLIFKGGVGFRLGNLGSLGVKDFGLWDPFFPLCSEAHPGFKSHGLGVLNSLWGFLLPLAQEPSFFSTPFFWGSGGSSF